MSEFSLVPLGQLADIRMGQSPDSTYVYEGSEQGVPFLQGNAEFGVKHPAAKYSCIQPAKIAEQGSSLISVRAPVGETNIADQLYCIGRGLAAVKFHRYGVFLGRELLSFSARRLDKVSQGTTFAAIGGADLRTLLIADIPEEEAKVLERVLDTLDTQIQKTEALIAKLEKVKEGLLHDLLTRGIDESGRLRPSPEQAPELYKESPLGLIPREWNYRQVISVANTYAGGTPSRNIPGFFGDEVPWVKSTEVNQESISSTEEKITELGLSKSSAKWVPEGTPLVAMYGATAGMVSWLTIRATTNQAVLAVVPSGNQCGRWIYWALTWSSSRLLASVQGSGQPNLSKGTIDALAMSVPKQSEQVLIANILDQHISRLASEKKYLMKIKAQKTALMDDLLTGRVRVTPLLDQAQATTPA